MFGLFSRKPVESPCRKACGLNESNTHCLGCFRTPREIAGWRQFTPRQQRQIAKQAALRGRAG